MCGFTGIISKEAILTSELLKKAGDKIRHRGPDHQGIYINKTNTVGFVHQRLSIIDLSSKAHQPMFSKDKRYMIVFNGEIYNYLEIKNDLKKKVPFFTNSDTEVILNLFIEKGSQCLNELNGMFAFAIWDCKEQKLFIARDRLGIKPLYYIVSREYFAFTSDLKSLQALPFIKKVLNQESIWRFLYFGYIPQPDTIFQNTFKLLPGHFLQLDKNLNLVLQKYWDIDLSQQKLSHSRELGEQFCALLQKSVHRRLISDVEMGACLSGGLDSSSIVSLLNRKIKSFTIGFEHQSNVLDLKRARELSQKYAIVQIESIIGKDSLYEFSNYLKIMDEPLAESSLLALLFNFKIAREHGVKVVLCGDGADEILGGYSYYSTILQFLQFQNIPKIFFYGLYKIIDFTCFYLKANTRLGKFRDLYLLKPLQGYLQENISKCHQYILSQNRIENIKLGQAHDVFIENLYRAGVPNLDRILFVETKTSLVNKQLAKVDKASMANSVEARVPFLDHELVEFIFRLPMYYKQSKYILKQAMQGIVPPAILKDRKRGFNLPMMSWMEKFFRENHELINVEKLENLGIISQKHYKEIMHSFSIQGKIDHSHFIWSLFVLSTWLQNNKYE